MSRTDTLTASSSKPALDKAGVTLLVARALLGGLFFVSGVMKVTDPERTIAALTHAHVPLAPVAYAGAVVVELVAPLGMLMGWKARTFAGVLIPYTVLATVLFHGNLGDPGQIIQAFKNLAIIGGLLLMIVHGPGSLSFRRSGPQAKAWDRGDNESRAGG